MAYAASERARAVSIRGGELVRGRGAPEGHRRGLLGDPYRLGPAPWRSTAGRSASHSTRAWSGRGSSTLAGLSGRSWPAPYGGRGAPAWQDDVVAEVQSRYGVSTKVLSVGLEMLPPVFVQHGTRRAVPALPAPGPVRHRDVVSAALRARRRIGPRKRHDLCRARARRMDCLRPEGMDLRRRHERLRPPDRADRPGDARHGRALLPHPRHVRARSRRSSAPPDVRRLPLQRGVPGGRPRARTSA